MAKPIKEYLELHAGREVKVWCRSCSGRLDPATCNEKKEVTRRNNLKGKCTGNCQNGEGKKAWQRRHVRRWLEERPPGRLGHLHLCQRQDEVPRSIQGRPPGWPGHLHLDQRRPVPRWFQEGRDGRPGHRNLGQQREVQSFVRGGPVEKEGPIESGVGFGQP